MSIGITSAILASIVSLTVAIAILLRRPQRRLYSRFALFTLALCLYHAGSLITRFGEGPMSPLQSVTAAFIAPLTLLFFADVVRDNSPTIRHYIRTGFLISGIFTVLCISPLGRSAFILLPLGIYVLAAGLIALKMLYQHTQRSTSDRERTRLRYLLYGGAITLFLAAGETISSTAVPAAMGHVAVTFYVYFLYQSIISQRLINLVELMGKAAVLGVLTLMLATIYSVLVLWVGSGHQGLWLFNTLVASFVILILYDQIRPWVETTTARMLFRNHYEFRLQAQTLERSLRTTISIDGMRDRILSAFTGSGTEVSIYLLDEGKLQYLLQGYLGERPPEVLSLSQHPTLLQEIRRERRPVILEELMGRAVESPALLTHEDTGIQRELGRIGESIEAMRSLRASVVIPMTSEARVVGLLAFGQEQTTKEAFTEYSAEDIVALMAVAEACAVVVENSLEYEKRRERDRLVEVGEMATGMAHEIRNPLGALKGAAQCLKVDELQPDQREFIGIILEEVDRLNGVVIQFLDYARPYRGDPIPCNVNDIIDATLRLMEHDALPTNVEVRKELSHNLPLVSVDPEHLKQVLINLFTNAFQAMPQGGKLTLTSLESSGANAGGDAPFHSLQNAQVLIKVTDSGPGISPDLFTKIFVPFFTTKAQGTGLGLPICQRIVESSGGRLEVASEPEEGTTFTVRLPALTPPPNTP